MIELEVDLHTHTLASGHAFCTIREMAKGAAEKGIKVLGITDHAKGIPGTCDDLYFKNLRVVPRKMFGIDLLLGAEVNILDYLGKLSLSDVIMDKMDIRIAGIHKYCYTAGNIDENTNAVVTAIKSPYIDIISHPDNGACPLNYRELVFAARDYNTLLELNNNSINPYNRRLNAYENNVEMLTLCKKYSVPIVVSSDAHDLSDIARTDFASKVIEEVNFPEELIVNKTMNSFQKYFGKWSARHG